MDMTARDFCIWLRQYLGEEKAQGLSASETAAIRQCLSGVFQHEIDPTMGDAAHQAMLNRIHGGTAH
jgi:hypothetical protein